MQDNQPKKQRDVRLDLFRGLAMLIIIVAHTPGNPWNSWIPARFGFSSAAEMFVFCSGIASALAFGRLFERQGFLLGMARVLYRIWQLYWAQLAVFLVVVTMSVWASTHLGTGNYIAQLYLDWFIAEPATAIPALLTLRYIPNFFDMLPLY
ncbi:MAG: OpgC domain-containing protein, partial [Bosea sp. (in: a-proteobacteria)]